MKLEELFKVWKMSNAYHIACKDWYTKIRVLGTKGYIERYKDGRIKSKEIDINSSDLSLNKDFQKYKDMKVNQFEVETFGTSNPLYILNVILEKE